MVIGRGVTYCVLIVCSVFPHSEGNFTDHPSNASIIAGGNATFDCHFTGDSPPLWDIFKDGVRLHMLNDASNQPPFYYPHVQMSPAVINVHAPGRNANETCYRCRINRLGEEDVVSNMACLIIYGPPQSPPDLTVLNRTYSSVSFSWGEPWSHSPITHYQLQILRSGSVVDMATRQVSESREHTFSNLVENTQYAVTVAAVGGSLTGETTQLMFTTAMPERPSPPTDVRAIIRIVATPQIIIRWNAPVLTATQSPITQYTISYKEVSAEDFSTQIHLTSQPDRSFSLPGVSLGKVFTVKVTATNSGGESNASSTCNISATYLQSVEVTPIFNALNVTCTFAETSTELQCRIRLTDATGRVTTQLANTVPNSNPPVASLVVDGLQSGPYMYVVSAVRRTDGTELESFNFTGSAQPRIESDSGTPLTTTQIGIIVGVASGTFVLILCALTIIVASIGFGDSTCKMKFKRDKEKHPNSNTKNDYRSENTGRTGVDNSYSLSGSATRLESGTKISTANTTYDV